MVYDSETHIANVAGPFLPASYIKEVRELADEHALPLHLDGACVFNAAIASNWTAAKIAEDVNSIIFSLSKGLAAPFGSMVCGPRHFVERVRRYRKLLGRRPPPSWVHAQRGYRDASNYGGPADRRPPTRAAAGGEDSGRSRHSPGASGHRY
ncbi:hypothetical protein CIT26_20660 [Mesorhizobium temperatum]|uniref:Aromatic amino acid beta-eliminating lyase/threonine aldolase domain-containing protein n=1 Tax=Mesorhizobium temperatum TaxID=241416 RepID=A0A271LHY1_9HYPH|nr:hypothetical protein CIT26_20660 [Mesorhizobium temperatum]